MSQTSQSFTLFLKQFHNVKAHNVCDKLLRYGLAIVLAAAGITKLVDSSGFVAVLQQLHFLNIKEILWIAALLPIIELGLALSLLVQWRPAEVRWMVFLIFAAFLGFGIYGWLTGMNGDCGCFGNLVKSSFGWLELLRNSVLFCAAGFLWALNQRS
jgi:hypothetical protein